MRCTARKGAHLEEGGRGETGRRDVLGEGGGRSPSRIIKGPVNRRRPSVI